MNNKVLGFAVAMSLSSSALAGSYQAQLSGGLGLVNVDGADNATILGVAGEAYFAPVDTSGKPLGEAAFLTRASNVDASLAFINSDDYDVSRSNIGVEVYIPNSIVYLGADYTRVDSDAADYSSWSITGGVTPIKGLLVTTTYVEDSGYDLNVAAKYVVPLSGDQAVSFFGSFVDDDSNTIAAGFDFYFNRNFNLGLELVDSGSDTSYTFSGDYFFSESLFVGAYLTNDDVADEIGVDVGMRF